TSVTSTSPATARNNRERSSTRWSIRRGVLSCGAAPWSGSVMVARVRGRAGFVGLVPGLGRGPTGADAGFNVAAHRLAAFAQLLAGVAQFALGRAQAASQFLVGQCVLQLALHRIPLRPRAPDP